MASSGPDPRNLYRLAVDLTPVGILAVDAEGRILLVNREVERLFGYARAELIGNSIEMLIPARFRAGHPAFRARYASHPSARPMGAGRDLYGLRRDGEEVPVEIGLNPVTTEEGTVVLASIVDITSRRAIEAQLRQSQKMEAIGTLAGGIAHDFNNLLLGIVGYTELAQTETSDAVRDGQLRQVLQAADRGQQLVHRILTFSRQRQRARTPIRLDGVTREVIQLLRASLPATIEIQARLDPATPSVSADEGQIHQAIMNLATNSARAMPHGGTIELELAASPSPPGAGADPGGVDPPRRFARLSVIDTGHGIAEGDLVRVFEPFFTTRPHGEGTGLGLSVVHGIVEDHGGKIEITSRVGEGTRVDIYLPESEPADAQEPGGGGERKRHILLVEDEESLARMLCTHLERMGYQVTVHTSSVTALEDFRGRPGAFDLLVTDNSMPKMTGLELVRHLLAARPDLPVLLTSGLAETANPLELEKQGIRRVLGKPYRSSELAEAVRSLLP